MKKRILISALAVMTAATTSLNAAEFDLRANMIKLNAELAQVQRGIIHSDEAAVSTALDKFSADVSDLLSDEGYSFKKKVYDMFPAEMKNKKHKVGVAMKSARTMETNIQKIKKALADKEGTELSRKRKAQEGYLNIVGACFECHNLTRDK